MLKKIIIVLIIFSISTSLTIYFYSQSKIPNRTGELKLDGLTDKVVVLYDNLGIPHITAKNDSDLYRAFGYVHAQDRLFQMEMMRRLSQGRLSEVFGEKLLDIDKLFRTFGLESYSKKWIAAMKKRGNKELFSLLDSYLAGVNEFVSNGTNPIEFDLLGFPEHQYTQEDVVSIAGYMAFSFAFAIKDDPLVSFISQKMGDEYLKDLGISYTPGFKQLPVDTINSDALNKNAFNNRMLSQKVTETLEDIIALPLFHGSNSWLVSPHRSASGKAMLINDPHIGYSQPSVWYEAQLKSDKTDIYGHFLALTPLPQLGFNQDIAWGLTMFENDDMDLYLEQLNPENKNQYWAIDHWQNFESRIEIIVIKDKGDLQFEVKESRHGPIINPIYKSEKGVSSPVSKIEQPIAVWWAFKDTDNQVMEGFYQLPHIKTIEEAAEVASKIHAPGLNLMFANSQGDIGWWASAKLPIRPEHVNSKIILDGASGQDDILGFYDFSYNPRQINPSNGVLYTANNQPADMGNGLVAGYYAPTDRPDRITELLSSREKLSVEFMKEMLIDSQSSTGKLFRDTALPVLKDVSLSSLEEEALSIYVKWNADHIPSEQGAAIHNRFRMSLMKLTMEDELGEDYYPKFQFSFLMARTIWRLLPNQESIWWDDVSTERKETRNELIVKAWQQAVSFLERKYSDDLSRWTWANEVSVIYEHPIGKQAPLDKIFNVGPFPVQQGIEVINNTRLKQVGDNFKVTMGPSTRRIIDFGDIENTWGILPTGQSGVVSDKHYDDQALNYSLGNFRHQYITEKQVRENLEGELVFSP